VSLNFPMRS